MGDVSRLGWNQAKKLVNSNDVQAMKGCWRQKRSDNITESVIKSGGKSVLKSAEKKVFKKILLTEHRVN